ncbi:MAG: M1 family metallopeptidase [Chloroflexi bacterium]|nr:M1 family metallopeptidase [Chloroflexota bacterium]
MKEYLQRIGLLALVGISLLLLPMNTAGAETPPSTTQYKITVDLDYDAGTVAALETVSYRNVTGVALSSIVFNVTPAYYRAFTLRGATVDGQTVQPMLDGVVMEVPLTTPLAPGATTRVALDFRLQVPSPGTLRFGKSGGILALGNWYPVISPFRADRGDWDRHRYTNFGDAFFTEVADYEVSLNVNRPVRVAHTGTPDKTGASQWTFSAKGVRDFALALSDRYESKSATIDGIEVTAFYLPQHAAGGELYLRTAVETVRWANRVLGTYPYPYLFVAETTSNDPAGVGQEYPNVVFISSQMTATGGGMGSYLSYLVAHEVLHQWFYGLVGDDQVYEPWVDESLVVNLSYEFFRANYPDLYPGMWQRLVDGERAGVNAYGDRNVDTSIYDYSNEDHYFVVVYRKGAIFLNELRKIMGDDAYFGLLKEFASRFSYRIATGAQFLDLAEARSSADLRPLIARYFSYPKYRGAADYDLPNGRFYTQTSGRSAGTGAKGFAVVNDADAPMWTEFQRLGGVAGLGYPVSRRFKWDGFTSQAMQKGVLQWQPQSGRAYLVNVFDEMSKKGMDGWLEAFRQVPQIADWSADAGRNWPDVVQAHRTLLEVNPAIKARYSSVADPVKLFGLPMSFGDMGNNYTLRAQRVVIQQWKVDVPWAAAGDVTVANGGDIAKEAGLLPLDALMPEEAP